MDCAALPIEHHRATTVASGDGRVVTIRAASHADARG
jgi:hypothetical protein